MQYNILAGNLGTPDHFPFAQPHLLHWPHRRQAIINKIKAMLTPHPHSSPPSPSPTPSPPPPPPPPLLPLPIPLPPRFTRCAAHVSLLPGADRLLDVVRAAAAGAGLRLPLRQAPVAARQQLERDGEARRLHGGVPVERHRAVVDVEQINYDDAHDRVALVVLLEWRERVEGCSPYVMLATTHLYWDAKRLSVQVNELDHLLTSIGRMQTKWTQAGGGSGGGEGQGDGEGKGEGGGSGVALPIPTVIAGDFNNGPSSQIYSRVVAHHTFHPLKTTRPATTPSSLPPSSSSSPPSSSSASSAAAAAPPVRHWLYRYDSSYAASGKEPPCTSVTHPALLDHRLHLLLAVGHPPPPVCRPTQPTHPSPPAARHSHRTHPRRGGAEVGAGAGGVERGPAAEEVGADRTGHPQLQGAQRPCAAAGPLRAGARTAGAGG